MSTGSCFSECLDTIEVPNWGEVVAGCPEIVQRTYGYRDPILFRCDLEFANIRDATEWTTHLEAGLIIPLPCGNFDPGEPTEDEVGKVCSKTYYDSPEYPFLYEVFEALADCKDEVFWDRIDRLVKQGIFNHFAFQGCADDKIYLPNTEINQILAAEATASNAAISGPGFTVSMKTPQFKVVNGINKNGKTEIGGTFTNNGSLISATIPGLSNALRTYTRP